MTLKQQTIQGVRWSTISSVSVSVLQFLQLIILARLLDSTDFGLISMIMVVIGFAQAFSDMGISNAIIHRQINTRKQLSSLYWMNIFVGFIIAILIVCVSPFITEFYNEPPLKNLLLWASLIFLITPIGQQFQTLLQKDLNFKAIAKVEIFSMIIGFFVSLLAAYLNSGAFSIILGQLVTTTIKALLFAVIGWRLWRPLLYFRINQIRDYISFGLYQMGERSVNYFSANVDYILVGKYLGPEILGIYTIAYQLVVIPLTKINPILTRVAFPVFAKLQNNDDLLREGYLKLIKLVAIIVFPILLGLAAVSKYVVNIFFGEGWYQAVDLIQILAILGILKALGNPSGSILLAKGRADIGFNWNLFVAITNTISFFFLVKQGIYALAWGYVILAFLYSIGLQTILNKIICLKWKECIKILIKPTLFSILMIILIYIMDSFIDLFILNEVFRFINNVLVGITVYVILNLLFEREYSKIILQFLKNKKVIN
jgi:O-antigen/teichoic acid export membrane protein